MSKVYRYTEMVGSSSTSIEDAINNALAVASEESNRVNWFEVVDTRGHVEGGKVAYYQVTVKIGYTHA